MAYGITDSDTTGLKEITINVEGWSISLVNELQKEATFYAKRYNQWKERQAQSPQFRQKEYELRSWLRLWEWEAQSFIVASPQLSTRIKNALTNIDVVPIGTSHYMNRNMYIDPYLSGVNYGPWRRSPGTFADFIKACREGDSPISGIGPKAIKEILEAWEKYENDSG